MPARRWLTEARAGAISGPNAEAALRLSLNEPEQALSVLERQWRELNWTWFILAPRESPAITSDPRFQRFLQRYREATMVR